MFRSGHQRLSIETTSPMSGSVEYPMMRKTFAKYGAKKVSRLLTSGITRQTSTSAGLPTSRGRTRPSVRNRQVTLRQRNDAQLLTRFEG